MGGTGRSPVARTIESGELSVASAFQDPCDGADQGYRSSGVDGSDLNRASHTDASFDPEVFELPRYGSSQDPLRIGMLTVWSAHPALPPAAVP